MTNLQPLHPIDDRQSYTSGAVEIDPSAAIAPGVLLQADPGSRIVVAAGASVGMGSVLHARNGSLEIGQGANLGAGVLLVGAVTVGPHACIGSASTVIDGAVAAYQIVSPGSLLGDAGRSVPGFGANSAGAGPAGAGSIGVGSVGSGRNGIGRDRPAVEDREDAVPSSFDPDRDRTSDADAPGLGRAPASGLPASPPLPPPQPFVAPPGTATVGGLSGGAATAPEPGFPADGDRPSVEVYGKVYLDRLMWTMFPHRQPLDRPSLEGGGDAADAD